MAMYFLRLPWVACWRGGLSKGRRTPRICPKPQTSSFPVVINLGASLKVCRLTWPNLFPGLPYQPLQSPLPSLMPSTYLPTNLTHSLIIIMLSFTCAYHTHPNPHSSYSHIVESHSPNSPHSTFHYSYSPYQLSAHHQYIL